MALTESKFSILTRSTLNFCLEIKNNNNNKNKEHTRQNEKDCLGSSRLEEDQSALVDHRLQQPNQRWCHLTTATTTKPFLQHANYMFLCCVNRTNIVQISWDFSTNVFSTTQTTSRILNIVLGMVWDKVERI